MPRILVKPDTLDQENRRFVQAPLRQPVFLNSVPKSGSHLLRNILRMFVPVEQQYQKQFVQWGNMPEHLDAWDRSKNYLSWGHLWFSDDSAIELGHVRKILLYRDPYDWVLARARFFLSGEFQGNVEHIKGGNLGVNDLLSLMIFGIHRKAPPMADIYLFNAVSWLGSDVHVVRFEDLAKHTKAPDTDEAGEFFHALIRACGIDPVPADWRDRVRVGSDRKQSGTARENLTGSIAEIPDELPDVHKRLLDVASPGLRQILGYA
jgi:hypothetical protein